MENRFWILDSGFSIKTERQKRYWMLDIIDLPYLEDFSMECNSKIRHNKSLLIRGVHDNYGRSVFKNCL
jgi:hypothetical protein